jgi:hypothetical protein
MFLRDLLKAFADAELRYCVVGGVAVNLHGVPRMTYDLDVVVVPEAEQLRRMQSVLVGAGLQVRVPVSLEDFADDDYRARMRDERNLIAVTFTDPADPLREIDVLVSPPVDASGIVERSVILRLAGMPVPVASVDDLVLMKKATGRPQDAADIAHLERIRRGAR